LGGAKEHILKGFDRSNHSLERNPTPSIPYLGMICCK